MAQNIKSSDLPPNLAPYISTIPTFQIENNQVLKISNSSQNQTENCQNSKNSMNFGCNTSYQQQNQSFNNSSSNNFESQNEYKETKNTIFNPISNITPLIQRNPEVMPQTVKTQIPIFNHLNSNDSLYNTPNLSNRSNIDIILNDNPVKERNFSDNRFNSSINKSNGCKNEPVITKKSNIGFHQIVSPIKLINQNNNLNNLNVNSKIGAIDTFNVNNESNSINASMNISNSSMLSSIPTNEPIIPKSSSGKSKKSPAYRKVMWTHAEDQLLIKTISRHGTNNWELVSNEVSGRTRKQCRERWAGILNPSLTKQPWTTEEDETLKMLHAQYGNKWAMIAAQMKGRSTIALRNRWSFHMRHAYREVKQAPFRFVIENRNGDFKNDSNSIQLNLGMNHQHVTPIIQHQQSQNHQQPIQIQSQNQMQLIQSIQVMPGPYHQVQQQNICGVYPVINQSQKPFFQPNQIQVQNIHPYPSIQIIHQPYEQQQMTNTPLNVVEFPINNASNPPKFS